ncbi:hypothetical protein [Ancylobacter sp.]|uniref:hypothetical protein n=1 Tax=Ancylobacter sp. TaxID=1872567 RepID=UPI003BACDFE5
MPMPCAPTARLPRRLAAAVPVMAGLCTLISLPAQAQMYVRPYGGVYVERYYGPPPAYYPPPPVYYPPPAAYPPPPPVYQAPGRFPFADVAPMLRSMGMSAIGRPRVDGNTYLVDATARSGARMRVRIDAYSGEVIAMHEIGQGPVGGAPSAPVRQALPAVAPLPPARPPELAAIPAPEPSAEATPTAAPDSSPSPAPAAPEPAANATTPASPSAATGASEPAPGAASPVRIIPGTAVPPSAMPAATASTAAPAAAPPAEPAKAAAATPAIPPAGSGTGTGVGTGSTVPAGTASVYARGASGKPAPTED